jgi:hypothetical protein
MAGFFGLPVSLDCSGGDANSAPDGHRQPSQRHVRKPRGPGMLFWEHVDGYEDVPLPEPEVTAHKSRRKGPKKKRPISTKTDKRRKRAYDRK